MADENVLREYLVSLGWKVDEAGKKRFDGALDSAGKTAAAVAAGLTAAATAIAATVIKIASGFDDLYFAAQRTNTSVANIKSLTYALSQLGVPASQAQSAIEGVARAIRTNPGTESLFRTLGVQTRDAKGQIRDTVDILVDLDKALSGKPQYIGAQYAAALGLDEATFNMIRGRAAEIKKLQEEYLKRAGELGVDPDKAAKAANELMTNFRQLQSEIGLVVDKIAIDLGPPINKTLNDLQAWIAEHKDEIIETIKTISKALVGVAEDIAAIVQNLQPLWDSFDGLAKAVTGKDGLQFALEAVLAYTAGAWLIGMRGAVFGVQAAFIALVAYLATRVHDEMQRVVGDALDKLNAAIGYQTPAGYDVQKERSLTTWDRIKNGWDWITGKKTYDEAFKSSWNGGGKKAGKTSVTANMDIPAEGRAFLDTIASTEAAGYNVIYGGKTFSDYSDHPRSPQVIRSGPNAGRTSTAAGRYQFLGTTWDDVAGELGLTDFSPESQDKAAWYLAQREYKRRTGRELEADLKSGDPDVIAAAGAALSGVWTSLPGGIEQGQGPGTMAGRYKAALDRERARKTKPPAGSYKAFPPPLTAPTAPVTPQTPAEPGDWWSRDDWLGGKPMMPPGVTNSKSTTNNVNPNTTINIYGSSDPVSTGREVEKAQGRVNQNIIGNVTGAVQ